jgi:hypothetical protein
VIAAGPNKGTVALRVAAKVMLGQATITATATGWTSETVQMTSRSKQVVLTVQREIDIQQNMNSFLKP